MKLNQFKKPFRFLERLFFVYTWFFQLSSASADSWKTTVYTIRRSLGVGGSLNLRLQCTKPAYAIATADEARPHYSVGARGTPSLKLRCTHLINDTFLLIDL